MTAPDAPVALDELLAQREWVRALARAIARDEHEAGDVEQATWVAAIESPPRHHGSLRGWLATTARHALARIRRSERRRIVHEVAAPARADLDDAGDAAELAARADAHRAVVEALLALGEPTRRTLLLRFFEGLPVAEVAARTGVPLETCRARLRRGVETLRDRFREREGGLAVVLLLLPEPRSGAGVAAATAAGGVVMGAKTVGAAVAVLLVIGAGTWWVAGRTAPRDPATVPDRNIGRSGSVAASPAERPPAPAKPRARADTATSAPTPAAVATPAAPEPPKSVKDRLAQPFSVSWEQIPLELALAKVSEECGVDVFLAKGLFDGKSAEEQSVQSLQLESGTCGQTLKLLCMMTGHQVTEAADRVVVHAMGAPVPATADQVKLRKVSEFAAAVVTVRVVTPDGAPVAGAVLRTSSQRVLATTDASGAAELRMPPPFPNFVVSVPGRVDSELTQPKADLAAASECRVVTGGPAGTIAVVVRTEDGRPAPGAIVRATPVTERGESVSRAHTLASDAAGEAADASAPPGPVAVRVGLRGWAPIRVVADVKAGAAMRVEVTLPREAVLEGVLRAADGSPLKGIVRATHETLGDVGGAECDAEGRFRIAGLPAGRLKLQANAWSAPGRPSAAGEVETVSGATTRWEPVLAPQTK